MKLFKILLLVNILVYLIFSFVIWELDPDTWGGLNRATAIVIAGLVVASILAIEKHEKN